MIQLSNLNESETELYPIVIEVPYQVARLVNEMSAASELSVTELVLKNLPLLLWKDRVYAKYLTVEQINKLQGDK